MGRTPESDLSATLDRLRDGPEEPSTTEIRAVVESVLSTMDGDISAYDVKIYAEIEGLAQLIQRTKEELASLRPEEISDEHIAAATDELDAVVAATEEATNAIMGATETIESIANALTGEHAQTLSDATTKIYEACSFQDITGQRITKVVKALKEIEGKIDSMMAAFGDNDEIRERARERHASARAAATAAGAEAELLQGPQLPENANNQDDIDALLDSLD